MSFVSNPTAGGGTLPSPQPNSSYRKNNNWAGTYKSVSLNEIEFPCEEVEILFKQRVVPHKRPGVPGAKLESLSRDPYIFKIKNALFINGLTSSVGEFWDGQQLFPGVFNQIFNLLTDSANNPMRFVHPTLGSYFWVKSISGSSPTSFECKNGQMMSFELMQDNTDLEDSNTQIDTRAAAYTSAQTFDTYYHEPKPPHFTSLLDLYNSVLTAVNTAVYDIQRVQHLVSFARSQINKLNAALTSVHDLAKSFLQFHLSTVLKSINDVANSTLGSVGIGSGASSFVLGRYRVPADTTVPQLATHLNNSVEQLVSLNNTITFTTIIKSGTKVNYNKASPILNIKT